jgi:hypothetical protein
MLFLQLFFCNHTAIRLQSHCDKVTIMHMRQGCNHALAGFCNYFFAIAAHQWLQLYCNGFCNHPYFTRLKPHQANTNLVAIFKGHAAFFQTHVSGSSESHTQICCNHTYSSFFR